METEPFTLKKTEPCTLKNYLNLFMIYSIIISMTSVEKHTTEAGLILEHFKGTISHKEMCQIHSGNTLARLTSGLCRHAF